MRTYGWTPVTVSHHLAMFEGDSSSANGDKKKSNLSRDFTKPHD